MNRPYPKYNPEIGVPTAYSHHGQQHHLHKQPGCKAANLSNFHNAKTCSPRADHVGCSSCVSEGKTLVLCAVEVSGGMVGYDNGKFAASRLRILDEIGRVELDAEE